MPTYTYDNTIPQASQRLKDSQPDLLENFQAIQELVEVNHVTFNTADFGKHKFVTFPVQNPAPTFGATELGLYSFLNGTTAKNELYVNKISGATQKQIPMTASTLSASSAPASGTGGWTYLPSGMFMTFGSGNANGLTTVTLSTPPPNAILNVQLTAAGNTTTYSNQTVRFIDILSNSQFRMFGSLNGAAGATGFTFLVIGY